MCKNDNLDDINDQPIIFGSQINDGINAPFADLYLDLFPELYDIE